MVKLSTSYRTDSCLRGRLSSGRGQCGVRVGLTLSVTFAQKLAEKATAEAGPEGAEGTALWRAGHAQRNGRLCALLPTRFTCHFITDK